ncbi:MAG: zinc ABC transporter substrate-binding protein [Phycisphaerales bacterium]|nr:zinc ABC transporter substrate-binding protein [Phycisphaerales bacterium]
MIVQSNPHAVRTISTLVSVGVVVLLAIGCERTPIATAAEQNARPLVVCTTTMIADLARQIGGDRIQVVCVMPPGTDPHIYEPRPADSVVFGKAALVLYNGLHLEGKMLQIIENAGARAVALAEDERIKVRESTSAKGAPDPHCWWNAKYFMVFAERARDALIRVDANGADAYRSATATYLQQLERADADVRRMLERTPTEQRFLITSHDAFYYFGEAYGLKVDAVLGISTDASVRALRPDELARLVINHRIPAIFHETSVSQQLNDFVDRVVEIVRRSGHDVHVPSEPLYSDSLGLPGTPAETYIGALRENARIIASALSVRTATAASSQPMGADGGQ